MGVTATALKLNAPRCKRNGCDRHCSKTKRPPLQTKSSEPDVTANPLKLNASGHRHRVQRQHDVGLGQQMSGIILRVVFSVISLGSPHVLRAHTGHMCGEPNGRLATRAGDLMWALKTCGGGKRNRVDHSRAYVLHYPFFSRPTV